MEYSHYLQQRFPAVRCTNAVKVASDRNLMTAQAVGYVQVAGFVSAFFGSAIFNAMSMPVPAWTTYLEENKGMAIAGFFMSNTVVSSLVQTGAFEVYLGGELLHSKMESGVLPDINTLVSKILERNPDLAQVSVGQKTAALPP
jgi:selT/selW/selH-like putative selenoprotein